MVIMLLKNRKKNLEKFLPEKYCKGRPFYEKNFFCENTKISTF